jgi:uncharacterized protein
MELNVTTILVTFAGVFLICFMKGAFGGGFAIVGIPLLSLVMDPVSAGGLLAPLFVAMDLFSLSCWYPGWWLVSAWATFCSACWITVPFPSSWPWSR